MWKKFVLSTVLISSIVLFVAYHGRQMITGSVVYGMAQQETQKRYGVDASLLAMPLLRPFRYSEGTLGGKAEFVLCSPNDDCYEVKAEMKGNTWGILDVVKK